MFKREGTYANLWLIHADVWQKPTQYCKVIIFQLKINTKEKMTNNHEIIKLRLQVFILNKGRKKAMMKGKAHFSLNLEKAQHDGEGKGF